MVSAFYRLEYEQDLASLHSRATKMMYVMRRAKDAGVLDIGEHFDEMGTELIIRDYVHNIISVIHNSSQFPDHVVCDTEGEFYDMDNFLPEDVDIEMSELDDVM